MVAGSEEMGLAGMAPSSTGQVQQGMIASHNKKMQKLSFLISGHFHSTSTSCCLSGSWWVWQGVAQWDEGAAARGIAIPAGVLPKPSPGAGVFHHGRE